MTLPMLSLPFTLGFLAAVAATIALLYVFKPAPRRLTVSSILIWRSVLRKRSRRPERLRWWVSLLLALAIALMLASSLVGSGHGVLGALPVRLGIVLDNSVTLAARCTDGKTRWDHAVALARDLIRRAGSTSVFLIADVQRTIASPRFEEAEPALATVGRLQVVLGNRPMFPDVRTADRAAMRLVLITDGVADLAVAPGTEIVSVFEPADNVGITAFDARAAPTGSGQRHALVEVSNTSPSSKRVILALAGPGHAAITRTRDIPAGTAVREIFDISSVFGGGPLQASIDSSNDALAVDDVAYAYLPSNKAIRVGLVGESDRQLERLLRMLPGVRTSIVPAQLAQARADIDVWVFNAYAPEQAPREPALIFHPPPVSWLPVSEGIVETSAISTWTLQHPVTSGLSLRDVLIDRALALHVREEVEVIASDARGRPMLIASRSRPRWVEAAFSLRDSTLATQPAFPILLSNVLEWLTSDAATIRAEPGFVRVPLSHAQVFDLHGRDVATGEAADATVIQAEQPGIYTATATNRQLRVLVNLTRQSATAINANRVRLPVEPAASPSAMDPWRTLLLAAALLLVLEWYTYNGRLTV